MASRSRAFTYEAPSIGWDSALHKTFRLLLRLMPASKRASLERGLGVAQLAPAGN